MVVVVHENFTKIGNPTISNDRILDVTNPSVDYIQTFELDFSKPFDFNFDIKDPDNSTSGTMFNSSSWGKGFNIYHASNNYWAFAIGNGSGYDDIIVYQNVATYDGLTLSWDGSRYTLYGRNGSSKTSLNYLSRSTPMPNAKISLGHACKFKLDLSTFKLTHKDGSYEFNLYEEETITTSDLLITLAEIKNEIKNAIIRKGGEITDSVPFVEYPNKVLNIPTGGGGILANVVGGIEDNEGIISNISDDAYISEVWNNNNQDVQLRFKFKVNSYPSTGELLRYVAQCENVFGVALRTDTKIIRAWSWYNSGFMNSTFEVPVNTWVYLVLKMTKLSDSLTTHEYYASFDRFSTSSTDLILSFDENRGSYPQSFLGRAVYGEGYSLDCSIDLKETCVMDHEGGIIRRYYK